MQNHFNISRFGKLFKKHTLFEHYKSNLMSIFVLIGIIGLLMGFLAYINSTPLGTTEQSLLFMIGLLGAGTIYTSMIFSDLSDKKMAIATLTLPASHFEKFFLSWIYSFVFFLIVYIIAFYIVDFIVVNMDNWHGQPKEILNIFAPVSENKVITVFVVFVFLHAISIWGALYFQKMHFIKTGFAVFLFILVLSLINYVFMELYLGKELQGIIPFGSLIIKEAPDQNVNIRLPESNERLITGTFILITLVLWAASYLRLKEKEV